MATFARYESRSKPASPMNVLFVGGYDSTNYVYVELVRELTARGHRCTIVVEDEGDLVNNKMFFAAEIDVVALAGFDLRGIGSYQFAVSGQFIRRAQRQLFDAISRSPTMLVSFANLFSSVTMRVPVDLVVTSSEEKFDDFEANGLRYDMVAVGNPQYDPLIRARDTWRTRHAGAEPREVLIVDQGAYPFGAEGKRQLAEVLVRIALDHPDTTFRVKPRYLPDEAGEHLHALSDHLYTHLHAAPGNLELLREPSILEDLVLDYDAMITTWSTAHLDAAILGMPMILVSGLASEDVFDVRASRVAGAYRHLEASGCVFDCASILDGRYEFRCAAPEYLAREFHDANRPAAPRVVDMFETLAARVISQGCALAPGVRTGCDALIESLRGSDPPVVSRTDPGYRARRDAFLRINPIAQELVFENRCLGMVLDMKRLLPYWERFPETSSGSRELEASVRDLARDLKRQYFAREPDAVNTDVFVQDAYFGWLHASRRYAEILGYAGPVIVPESLAFYRGLVMLRRWRLLRAAREFVDSFSVSLLKSCRVLRRDKHIATVLAKSDRSLLAHAILVTMALHGADEPLSRLDVTARPGFNAVAYHRARALRSLGRRAEALTILNEHAAGGWGGSPSVRKGLAGMVLRALDGLYGLLARRLRDALHRARA